MLKNIINVGVTFKNLDFDTLELFFFKNPVKTLHEIKTINGVDGCVLIQTCNRVEIFVSSTNIKVHHNLLELFINNFIKNVKERSIEINLNDVIKCINIVTNIEAIRRIFRIASGLESLAIGEDEILKQVKDAVELSKKEKCIDDFLLKVFEKAIKVARKIKKNIKFDCSITNLSIEYLKRNGINLDGKNILLIGAGKVARQVLKLIRDKNRITISNRTYERAKILAEKFNTKIIKFDEIKDKLKEFDIIISAIYTDKYIINKNMLSNINKNLVILDLGFPKTIDPNVKELGNVELVTISNLRNMYNDLVKENIEKIKSAQRLIDEEVDVLIKKFYEYLINDLVKQIYIKVEEYRQKELNEVYSYLKNLSDRDKKILDNFSKALVKSIINPIVENLKNRATELDRRTIELLKKIFLSN